MPSDHERHRRSRPSREGLRRDLDLVTFQRRLRSLTRRTLQAVPV